MQAIFTKDEAGALQVARQFIKRQVLATSPGRIDAIERAILAECLPLIASALTKVEDNADRSNERLIDLCDTVRRKTRRQTTAA